MTMEKKYEPLKILFGVLLFGGLWGILEATLGTLLHLPFAKAIGMYASSTTIMVPIAFMLMGACYKKVGNCRSVFYMGILAASIKAIVCAIFHLSFNPVYYILMEALIGAGALLIMRPKQILSFKGLGTFIIANTTYLVASTFLRISVVASTWENFIHNVETYALMMNCLAILYTFAVGAILYGLVKLAEAKEWKLEGLKKVAYSPITASIVAATMVVVTFLVR